MKALMLVYKVKRKLNKDYIKRLKYKRARLNKSFIVSCIMKGI